MMKQRYTIKRETWEKLCLQQRYMFRKAKSAVESDPKKIQVGSKRRREPNKRRWGWRLAWWGSTEKNEASHLRGLRGGEGPNGQIVSLKRTADGRRQRGWKIINEESEKNRSL